MRFDKIFTHVRAVSHAWAMLSVLIAAFVLTGCDGHKIIPKNKDDKAAAEPTVDDAVQSSDVDAIDPNAPYHFNAWQKEPVTKLSQINASSALVSLKAKPSETRATLDYFGESALGYDLHGDKPEYIKVIDSPNLLEINWLRPDETDIPESKMVSRENTHRVYNYARAIMGQAGGDLVKTMVEDASETKENATDTTTASQSIAGRNIIMAHCDHFDCHLIVKK